MAWSRWEQRREEQQSSPYPDEAEGIDTEELAAEGMDTPSGGQEKAPQRLPPVKLPVRRKRATKQEVKQLEQALDPSPLAVLPPHVIEQLTWRQELWLAARVIAYSDHQTNLNTGITKKTLLEWKEQEAFKQAYEVITMDPLNMQLLLNRLTMVKLTVQIHQLMQHPSLPIRLRVMEMASRNNAAVLAAEAKTKITQQNNFFAASPMEWLRQAAAQGLVMPVDRDPEPELDPGTGIIGLLPGSFSTLEAGPVHEDSGRERRSTDGLPLVGLAGGPAQDGALPEVLDHPQGPAAGGVLVDGFVGLVDGQLPPEQ